MSLLCLALAAAQPQAADPRRSVCPQASTWRPIATDADRQRLRDTRTSWEQALGTVPAGSDPLLDPDRALDTPLPPAGAYRCRIVNLGGATRVTRRDWGRCAIAGQLLTKLDGPQRPIGRLFADSDIRGVFLGTLELGDETRPMPYGRDAARNLIGAVERIDAARWRIALPRPAFGGTVDLLELEPAS